MLELARGLDLIRDAYRLEPTRELMRVLLNATSPAEAALALRVLGTSVPNKALVAACNLREVLASLPTTPFAMPVDPETFEKTGGLTRSGGGSFVKEVDELGRLNILTAGNLVLDIVVRGDAKPVYIFPTPRTTDYITVTALDRFIESDTMFTIVTDVIKAMGIALNPPFYLSTEDFQLEHARDTFECLGDLF